MVMAKAILLLSGGLDSTLAGKLLLELGIEVEAISFVSPFCQCTPRSLGCPAAQRSAEQLGIPVRVFGCGMDYLEQMKHPRFARGRGMNACLDCRIFMFTRARERLAERGADFVATGEVLGERPMSQRRDAMAIIERESGLRGLIVRPLCARLLPPSLPEERGLVDREKLRSIQGRSRRPQFALAEELGIEDYLCPAGGCLLTVREFAARFRDLLEHEPEFGLADARLLKVGRHFRLPRGAKLIVARDEAECGALEQAARPGDAIVEPKDTTGPSALCRGTEDGEAVATAARLVATYTKGGTTLGVEVRRAGREPERISDVSPLSRDVADLWRVGARSRPRRARHEVRH
jgi:tRNA U34 2-thiouridine synthase MnmA/TrmU